MSTKHLSQLPQLFRSPFLRKVALGHYYKELSERLEIAGLSQLLMLKLSDIFESVYEILLQNYRCEYVFKNTLMQNWFLSRHSTDHSFITDEFRVGKSRVDLALFSKTSFAFEIKTEFDSPTRLPSQSNAYMKVFDYIYIVTTSSMLPKLKIPKSVGILQLEKSGSFKTVRDSESHANKTGLLMAFNCLWQSERLEIVETNSKPIKKLPNSEIYVAVSLAVVGGLIVGISHGGFWSALGMMAVLLCVTIFAFALVSQVMWVRRLRQFLDSEECHTLIRTWEKDGYSQSSSAVERNLS
jgi:hypothetical protein